MAGNMSQDWILAGFCRNSVCNQPHPNPTFEKVCLIYDLKNKINPYNKFSRFLIIIFAMERGTLVFPKLMLSR